MNTNQAKSWEKILEILLLIYTSGGDLKSKLTREGDFSTINYLYAIDDKLIIGPYKVNDINSHVRLTSKGYDVIQYLSNNWKEFQKISRETGNFTEYNNQIIFNAPLKLILNLIDQKSKVK